MSDNSSAAARTVLARLRLPGAMLAACLLAFSATAGAASAPIPVKVMVVNMFKFEAAPWLEALHPDREIPVPGLPPEYPAVHCTDAGVCQMTTGMGHANAAASLMAVVFSPLFDLHRTYFVIAGIGGIDPERGTLGTVAWARYVVDSGIAHEIDAREAPAGWEDGFFGVMTDGPRQRPKFEYRTELYQLDEELLRAALALSQAVPLADSADAAAYRGRYPQAAAKAPPTVVQCDTLSADTWWAGRRLGEHARRWTRLLTNGAGVYCTTQQEDNATLNALTRGSQAGLLDIKRVAVLRSGSDFDRPYPHQSAFDSLVAQRKLDGAFHISTENLVRAGMPLVEAIAGRWEQWRDGVPPGGAPHP
jgi:purine nucleoside permease